MIKEPNSNNNMTMTIKLRDGTFVQRADTTPKPFGDNEKLVAFWNGGSVRIYPMDLVEYVELHFDDA